MRNDDLLRGTVDTMGGQNESLGSPLWNQVQTCYVTPRRGRNTDKTCYVGAQFPPTASWCQFDDPDLFPLSVPGGVRDSYS